MSESNEGAARLRTSLLCHPSPKQLTTLYISKNLLFCPKPLPLRHSIHISELKIHNPSHSTFSLLSVTKTHRPRQLASVYSTNIVTAFVSKSMFPGTKKREKNGVLNLGGGKRGFDDTLGRKRAVKSQLTILLRVV